MKLRKCLNYSKPEYTLKEICSKCNKQTIDAHYKYLKLPDAPKDTAAPERKL